jgi:hypothetical protein
VLAAVVGEVETPQILLGVMAAAVQEVLPGVMAAMEQ